MLIELFLDDLKLYKFGFLIRVKALILGTRYDVFLSSRDEVQNERCENLVKNSLNCDKTNRTYFVSSMKGTGLFNSLFLGSLHIDVLYVIFMYL